MAEIMEQHNTPHTHYASNAKANAGLTLGIIGTSLAGLTILGGGLGNIGNLLGGNKTGNGNCNAGLTNEDLYLERTQCANYLETTKQYYEGQMAFQTALNRDFALAYERDVKNSFDLYKGQRDIKDELQAKIDAVDKKVDVMAAIRPYQDALINCKIDNNALIADYNLSRRTCRMIQGELVLPSTPTVTGYASFYPCNPTTSTTGA